MKRFEKPQGGQVRLPSASILATAITVQLIMLALSHWLTGSIVDGLGVIAAVTVYLALGFLALGYYAR